RQIKKLLRANKEALFKALKSASAKKFAEDISLQIQKTAQKYGFYPVKELSGHGIGPDSTESPRCTTIFLEKKPSPS
ncbi:M24 family metallopeptidase, partial [bacterium]|nr:M24 family metallopeptidase [bacterium]